MTDRTFPVPGGVLLFYKTNGSAFCVKWIDARSENPILLYHQRGDTRRLEETEVVSKMLLDFIMNRGLSGKNKERM